MVRHGRCPRSPTTHLQAPKSMVKDLYQLNNTYRVLRKHFGLIRGQNNTKHEPQPKFSVITQNVQTYKITP